MGGTLREKYVFSLKAALSYIDIEIDRLARMRTSLGRALRLSPPCGAG